MEFLLVLRKNDPSNVVTEQGRGSTTTSIPSPAAGATAAGATTTADQPAGSAAAGAGAGDVIHRHTDDRTDESYFILENDSLHLARNRVPRRSKKIPTNFFMHGALKKRTNVFVGL